MSWRKLKSKKTLQQVGWVNDSAVDAMGIALSFIHDLYWEHTGRLANDDELRYTLHLASIEAEKSESFWRQEHSSQVQDSETPPPH